MTRKMLQTHLMSRNVQFRCIIVEMDMIYSPSLAFRPLGWPHTYPWLACKTFWLPFQTFWLASQSPWLALDTLVGLPDPLAGLWCSGWPLRPSGWPPRPFNWHDSQPPRPSDQPSKALDWPSSSLSWPCRPIYCTFTTLGWHPRQPGIPLIPHGCFPEPCCWHYIIWLLHDCTCFTENIELSKQ